MIRIGSLFSGYGGLDLAVQSVLGGEIAWHVEYVKAPSRILDHHVPGVPNYGDVTQLDFTTVEPVDVLTGGYPCQPFSHAGLRKGTDDERHLWPHVLRAIREMGPRLAILENVRGHLSLGFGTVLSDLASVGWSARWGVVRASDAGAPHQRARLFIVAYPDGGRREQHHQGERLLQLPNADGDNAADATGDGRPQGWTGSGEWAGSTGQPSSDLSTPADASGQRHGRGQDAGMVGRLGATAEGSGRQASAPRSQSGNRGPAATADAVSGGRHGRSRQSQRGSVGRVAATGTGQDFPADADLARLERSESSQQHELSSRRGQGYWGDYGPAIVRWERVIGRPAPAPTEPGRTGAPRLSPAFVEWMMGLPPGWVTDPSIGISRNDQLKALGNGVVPQQAALALDVLLKGATDDLRQILATV